MEAYIITLKTLIRQLHDIHGKLSGIPSARQTDRGRLFDEAEMLLVSTIMRTENLCAIMKARKYGFDDGRRPEAEEEISQGYLEAVGGQGPDSEKI